MVFQMPVTPFSVVHHRMRTLAIDYQSTPRHTQVGEKERVPRFSQQKRSTRRIGAPPKIPSVEKTNQSEKLPSFGDSSSGGNGGNGGSGNSSSGGGGSDNGSSGGGVEDYGGSLHATTKKLKKKMNLSDLA